MPETRHVGFLTQPLNLLHFRVLLELELGEVENGRAYLANMRRTSSYAGPYPLRAHLQTLVLKQVAFLGLASHKLAFESSPAEQPTSPNGAGMLAGGQALTAIQEANLPEAAIAMRSLKPLRGSIVVPPLLTDRLLGLLSHTLGRLDQGAGYYDDALAFCRNAGYAPEGAWVCFDYARLLAARDRKEDRAKALSLLAEAEQIFTNFAMRLLHDRVVEFREQPPDESRKRVTELSPREQQVVGLLAQGLTNRQIAERLVVTERTVASHIEHILNKLGFASRHQVGAWADEHGLSG